MLEEMVVAVKIIGMGALIGGLSWGLWGIPAVVFVTSDVPKHSCPFWKKFCSLVFPNLCLFGSIGAIVGFWVYLIS